MQAKKTSSSRSASKKVASRTAGKSRPRKTKLVMPKEVQRIWNALCNSITGITSAWDKEAAFRIEAILGIVLLGVVIYLPADFTQKAILVLSVFLVLLVELINSAVEATVDRISLNKNALSKRAKDISSAAVLVGLLNCLVVWLLILDEVYSWYANLANYLRDLGAL